MVPTHTYECLKCVSTRVISVRAATTNTLLYLLAHALPCTTHTITQLQTHVTAAVYRLWRCNGASPGVTNGLDPLGFASLQKPYHGGRNYWFPRRVGLNNTAVCSFAALPFAAAAGGLTLTAGRIPYDASLRLVGAAHDGLLSITGATTFRFNVTSDIAFHTYAELKAAVEVMSLYIQYHVIMFQYCSHCHYCGSKTLLLQLPPLYCYCLRLVLSR
jgi:hypothetical protein